MVGHLRTAASRPEFQAGDFLTSSLEETLADDKLLVDRITNEQPRVPILIDRRVTASYANKSIVASEVPDLQGG